MKILNRREVQELLGLSEKATYKLLKETDCPLLKIDSHYRIIEEDLINWLRTRDNKKVG